MILPHLVMTDPIPAKPKRSKAKKFGIVIGAVVGGLVALGVIGLLLVNVFQVGTVAYVPSNIIVSGTASTVGAGTHPVGIIFTDQGSGGRVTDDVNSNGYYSVELPNGNHSYKVQLAWEGFAGATGICEASALHFGNEMQAIQNHNFKC